MRNKCIYISFLNGFTQFNITEVHFFLLILYILIRERAKEIRRIGARWMIRWKKTNIKEPRRLGHKSNTMRKSNPTGAKQANKKNKDLDRLASRKEHRRHFISSCLFV